MRGERPAAETIELELTAEQLRTLSEQLAEEAPRLAVEDVSSAKREVRRPRWTGLVAAAAALSGISSGITYLALRHAEPARAEEQRSFVLRTTPDREPAQPLAADVHFVNPFDKTETFQFPPGTSEKSAREAVAELLLKRAQERLAAADELRRHFRRAHEPEKRAASLTTAASVHFE